MARRKLRSPEMQTLSLQGSGQGASSDISIDPDLDIAQEVQLPQPMVGKGASQASLGFMSYLILRDTLL